jgi:hypothetical protein
MKVLFQWLNLEKIMKMEAIIQKRIAELKPVLREALSPGRSERDRFLDAVIKRKYKISF